MAPLMDPVDRSGAAGAAEVSLKSMGDVLVMAALFFAAVVPLLFLLGVADWLWKRARLGPIDEVAGLWGEPILALGTMILPLAWISRRWRFLEIPPVTAPAAGAAIGQGAGLLGTGISYPVHWLGQWTGNDILPSNAV